MNSIILLFGLIASLLSVTSYASNEITIEDLIMIEEQGLSEAELQEYLREVNPQAILTEGNYPDIVTDSNYPDMITDANYPDIVTEGDYPDIVTNSNYPEQYRDSPEVREVPMPQLAM